MEKVEIKSAFSYFYRKLFIVYNYMLHMLYMWKSNP